MELSLKSRYENLTVGGITGSVGLSDQGDHVRAFLGNISVLPHRPATFQG